MVSKPWQLKAWKIKREEKLLDSCQQCGSTKKPLVLQHTKHPPKAKEVYNQISFELFNKAMKNEEISLPDYNVLTCPKCCKPSFYERKTMIPTYRCCVCAHTFDIPTITKYKDIPNLNVTGFFNQFRGQKQTQEKMKILARERMEENYKEYMSCEHTTTFCQKCAFLWDMKGMKLCNICKKKYHAFHYSTCFDCNPEKNKILERKNWMDVFEKIIEVEAPCGIIVKMCQGAYGVCGIFEYCHNCDKFQECKDYTIYQRKREAKEREEWLREMERE